MNPGHLPDRRRWLSHLALLATGLPGLSAPGRSAAQAPAFPSRPITLLVGSTPGSTTDGLARGIGQHITRETGQPVVVENRAGASGMLAFQAAMRAAPDGYTWFITTNTTQAANPYLLKSQPYDPMKDLVPVGQLVQGYMLMVVPPSSPARTVAEFIALARKQPGKLSFGAGSSSARVGAEQFIDAAGIQMTPVPYKGNPQAVLDLVGGQTDMMVVDLTTSLPQVKAGKLRALAVTSPQRSPLVPEVPTMAEQGLPGVDLVHWNALYVPNKTPPALIGRIQALAHQAMRTDTLQRFVHDNGLELKLSQADELARFQQAELARWGRIIHTAGIQPE